MCPTVNIHVHHQDRFHFLGPLPILSVPVEAPSLHHLYCCTSFIMYFSLTLPVHSACNGSHQALVPVCICTRIVKRVVAVVQSTILLVQRKRCLGKCFVLICFFRFTKEVHKGQTKGGFFYWYDWINPSLGQSCLSPSSFASMTTFICYYKHVHQHRWLLLHFISPGSLSKK